MATKLDTVVSVILDSSGMAVGVKNANGQIRNLQGQFMKLKEDMQLVEKGTERFATAMAQQTQKANSSIKDSTNQMTSFKGVLESMFKPITSLNQAFGVVQQSLYIVQRAFALTVGSAAELELQVARITTVLDDAEVGQVDFAKRILEMQRVFGANPTEAAKGFYEAIASGATNAAGSIDLMATAQKLAVGGLLPLDKALSGLTSVMASYGYEANQTRYISDGFFIAAAKGKTNVEELTMEIGNVSSIAQQANVSFEELVSAVSAVTLGGKRTAEATTSVRSAINALLTPTEQLQYVYDQLGISSVTAEIKQRGLQAVYEDIYKYVNFNVEALSKLVGRIEAVPAVVALTTGKQKAAYNDMLGSITDNTRQMGDVTEKAFDIIAQTSAHRMEVAKGSISASLTAISQAFMVVLTPIVEIGSKILSAILTPIEATSAAFVTFSKSTNEYVIPALVALGATFVAMKIPVITASFSSLAAALTAVSTASLLVAGKFALIAAAVVAVTAVVDLFIKNIELIPEIFVFVMANIIKYSAKVIEVFQQLKESLGFETNLDQTRIDIKNLESASMNAAKNIKNNFNGGMFKGAIDGVKAFMDVFSDASSKTGAMGGAAPSVKPPKETKQGKAPDIAAGVEASKKALEEYNALVQRTGMLKQQNNMANLEGVDLIKAQVQAELENIKNLEKELALTKQLTPERKKQIEAAKGEIEKSGKIKIDAQSRKEFEDTVNSATGVINSATGGANAAVGSIINTIGKSFGPEGQMVAAAINLLRMGKDFTKQLFTEVIKITIEIPLMLSEGIVGLIEGLLQGVIDMLGDPARLAKIMTALTNLVPRIITALAKAIPSLLKLLLDPGFWIEFASQIVRNLWDALVEMFYALGDMLASIFSGDIFEGPDKAIKQMGETVDSGIRYATNAITGVSDQMFGVMEDTAQAQAKGGKGGITKTSDSSAKKKEANWFQKYIIDPLAKVVNFIWNGLSNAFGYIWGLLEPILKIVMTVIGSSIQGAMEVVIATFKIVGIMLETTWNVLMEVLKGVWNTLMAVFKAVWNIGVELFKGVINYLKAVWDGIVDVLRALWDFVVSLFKGIVNSFKAVFNFIVTLFDDPIKAFEQLWEDLKNIFSDLWESIEGIGTALWDAISGIGEAIWDMFKGVGGAIWEGLKSVGSAIWDMFAGVGGAIWEGVKKGWDAIVGLFSTVGTILWDALSGVFDSIGSFFKNLFKFDGGGTDVVEKFLGFDFPWIAFAEGGKVPGAPKVFGDSNKNDTVAALLSPGEYVIPRSKMQDPENLMLIDAIMSGGKMKDWIMNAFSGGVQQKAYGEWIQKAQSGGLEFHAWYDGIGDAIVSGVEGAGDFIADTSETVWEGLKEAGSFIGDVFVPDDIKKLWDSITRFISNIDLTRLITDPVGMLKDAIKFASDFLVEPFKKMMSFNTGGLVPGYGFSDSVPAMLTPGEFVINRNAAQALGGGLLNQLNAGMMPSMGGMGQNATFNITLNIETTQAIDETFIRQKLLPTIKQEIKSSSLRGEFLLSDKGVRR